MGMALLRGASTRDRRAAAVLVGASLAADLGWCVLTLVGVEGGYSLGSQALHAPRLPWSHSLVSTGVLALAAAAIAAAIGDRASRPRLAILAVVAVFAHWLVGDVPFGEAFPLTPWSPPLAMPHLYAQWPLAFAIEVVAIAGGVAIAAPVLGRRRMVRLTAVLLALHLFAWFPSFLGRAPIDLQAEPYAIAGYLVLLLAAWAACIVAMPVRPRQRV